MRILRFISVNLPTIELLDLPLVTIGLLWIAEGHVAILFDAIGIDRLQAWKMTCSNVPNPTCVGAAPVAANAAIVRHQQVQVLTGTADYRRLRLQANLKDRPILHRHALPLESPVIAKAATHFEQHAFTLGRWRPWIAGA
jgi:hypothetical protein